MIRPDQLRALREQRGLTLEQLAEQSRVAKRTIQRLEKGEIAAPRGHTAKRLAKALGVKPADLGEEPRPGGKPVHLRDALRPETWLHYELIGRRFGVRVREVIEMAPLMFALLAEQSLAWRREQLGQFEDALNTAAELGKADRLRFTCIDQARDYLVLEENAIWKGDLFGDPWEDVGDATYFEPGETVNPFADYLRHLAADLEDEKVSVGYDSGIPNVPSYRVYDDELERIIGGSKLARFALVLGEVKIADIPDELLAEDAPPEERAAWIESSASEDLRSLTLLWKPAGEQAQR